MIDAARYAENSYFVKQREPEFKNSSIQEIVRESFKYADVFTMSAKRTPLSIWAVLWVRATKSCLKNQAELHFL